MMRGLCAVARLVRLQTVLSVLLVIGVASSAFAQSRVSGGGYFTLVVTDSGNVWSFGNNSNGQLGLGHTTDSTSPTQVPGLSNVVAVATGGSIRWR